MPLRFLDRPGAAARRRASRHSCDLLEPRWVLSASTPLPAPPPLLVAPPAVDAAAARPASGPVVVRNIVYTTRGGVAEALDVYLPRGAAPAGGWPVIVAIHGGGWRQFDRSDYAAKVAQPLVSTGFAVVAPDYALSAPGAPSWPLAYDDVRDAVGWVRGPGGRFSLSQSRIAAMGESSGGHLALLLGTELDPATRVGAVIDFFGPTDLAAMVNGHSAGAPAVVQFLGSKPAQNPAAYAAASPIDRVTSRSAPVLILQGTADTVVPLSQSQELAAACTAAGVPNRLILIRGATHGFGLRVGNLNLLPDVVSFLRTNL
jgi:acetyl esterase/lipase